jgi:hypothetical protein
MTAMHPARIEFGTTLLLTAIAGATLFQGVMTKVTFSGVIEVAKVRLRRTGPRLLIPPLAANLSWSLVELT